MATSLRTNKRPASMNHAATPHFVSCPVAPLPRPASAYAELESPPSSPILQQSSSSLSLSSDFESNYHQPSQPRRTNVSRPIRLPSSLPHLSHIVAEEPPPLPLPPKKYALLATESIVSAPISLSSSSPSPSHSRSPSSSSKVNRISALFARRSRLSIPSVSIHPEGHHSAPNIVLAVEPSHDFLVLEDMDDSYPDTPVSKVMRVPSITINSNYSNIDLSSIDSDSSSVVDLGGSGGCGGPFMEYTPEERQADGQGLDVTDNNKASDSNGRQQQDSLSKRRKTLLKSVSLSVIQAKERATQILFGSIPTRSSSSSSKAKYKNNNSKKGSPASEAQAYSMSSMSMSATPPFSATHSSSSSSLVSSPASTRLSSSSFYDFSHFEAAPLGDKRHHAEARYSAVDWELTPLRNSLDTFDSPPPPPPPSRQNQYDGDFDPAPSNTNPATHSKGSILSRKRAALSQWCQKRFPSFAGNKKYKQSSLGNSNIVGGNQSDPHLHQAEAGAGDKPGAIATTTSTQFNSLSSLPTSSPSSASPSHGGGVPIQPAIDRRKKARQSRTSFRRSSFTPDTFVAPTSNSPPTIVISSHVSGFLT
ncbi:hypothetical protein BGX33_011744 [Mortierella sp. NVP41]|nr:hypothetical protein BGX33_011744 [Mortierella sp. NVP41]